MESNGHKRSDMRQPIEVIKILDQKKIPEAIKAIKNRMLELDQQRNK